MIRHVKKQWTIFDGPVENENLKLKYCMSEAEGRANRIEFSFGWEIFCKNFGIIKDEKAKVDNDVKSMQHQVKVRNLTKKISDLNC